MSDHPTGSDALSEMTSHNNYALQNIDNLAFGSVPNLKEYSTRANSSETASVLVDPRFPRFHVKYLTGLVRLFKVRDYELPRLDC